MPVAGFLVGWVTNYLALKVIFRPLEPKQILCWTVQGIFLKRQHEVSATFARVIITEILHIKVRCFGATTTIIGTLAALFVTHSPTYASIHSRATGDLGSYFYRATIQQLFRNVAGSHSSVYGKIGGRNSTLGSGWHGS